MKLEKWLKDQGLEKLRFTVPFLQAEFKLKEGDKRAAWELYVELLTRVTTQRLPVEDGDEETALNNVYSLFQITRDILKARGPHCAEFTKISVVVLNQTIRPFTAKWHKVSVQKGFKCPEKCKEFRKELDDLREILCTYTRALSNMAEVEDLTEIGNLEKQK